MEEATTTLLDAGPSSGGCAPYLLGTSDAELEHLTRQAEELTHEAAWLLDTVGVEPGWRVIDVACGVLGILHLLPERVGTTGQVVGLDREARMIDTARSMMSQRRLPVRLIRADATATGLPREWFDLVHARALLLHVTSPEAVIREMTAICRPGGAVALQEADTTAWVCDPPHPAWDRLLNAFQEVYRAHGQDTSVGRRLPTLLGEAGLTGVEGRIHARLTRAGDYYHTFLLTLMTLTRDTIVTYGCMSAGELDELTTSLRAHLEHSTVVTSGVPIWQVWAWKR